MLNVNAGIAILVHLSGTASCQCTLRNTSAPIRHNITTCHAYIAVLVHLLETTSDVIACIAVLVHLSVAMLNVTAVFVYVSETMLNVAAVLVHLCTCWRKGTVLVHLSLSLSPSFIPCNGHNEE